MTKKREPKGTLMWGVYNTKGTLLQIKWGARPKYAGDEARRVRVISERTYRREQQKLKRLERLCEKLVKIRLDKNIGGCSGRIGGAIDAIVAELEGEE